MKFAYMIMAHNEPYILMKLINMLDYPENDIYLHVDRKSTCIDVSKLHVNFANLTIVPSQKVTWGGKSQISTELLLMEEAVKTKHDYYHLISGVDLPLLAHENMMTFFEKYYGDEFIGISPNWVQNSYISGRYKLHWFFQEMIGKQKNIIFFISRTITNMEKIMHITRKRNESTIFYGGPNWFSITEKAVFLILQHKDWILKRFKSTICCDEIFCQTIIGNSVFGNKIHNFDADNPYEQCLRYVVFGQNSPFVLDMSDYDDIISSGCLFARKFGTKTNSQKELVDKIYTQFC